MEENKAGKFVHAQCIVTETELKQLKAKTGTQETGMALRIAIEKYLEE